MIKADIHPTSYGPVRVVSTNRDTAKLTIGAYCSFAEGTQIMMSGEHNADWVSTYPFSDFAGWDAERISGHPKPAADVTVGNDVWVGNGALILPGTQIGDGAVIGARTIVRGEIAPYSIVLGAPGRRIGQRFSNEIVQRLLAIRWWAWPRERVKAAVPMLMSKDVEAFCLAVEEGRI